MEEEQVPWWRKALKFALGGIRTGFGLFSRGQKHHDEIEPDTVAGYKEIQREEAELTEYSPEQEIISKIAAVLTPNAEPAETTQMTAEAEPQVEAKPKEELLSEPQSPVEAIVDDPAPKPAATAAAEVVVAFEMRVQTIADQEPAEPVEAAVQIEDRGELKPLVEDSVESEPVSEPDVVQAVDTPILDSIDVVERPIEAREQSAREDPVAAAEEQTQELELDSAADAKEVAESPPGACESEPAPPAIEEAIELEAEEIREQVTEQPVTIDNVTVDEVTPQADAAISEAPAPEPASPDPIETEQLVLQENVEPIQEPVETAAEQTVAAVIEQTSEQIVEPAGVKPAEQIVNEVIVDQAIEQPMELNPLDPKTVAEQEQSAEPAVPVAAAEEFVSVPEAAEQAPPADDEPAEPAAVAAAAHHHSKPFIKLEAREGEANASPFSVIVSQVYDGPLDLLLDLIRKQDIDIYDIPIARITAQFLAYVNQLKASDVDVAGEFIYTASLLIHIKSKMLLPRAPSGPEDAAEDPRRELVERLLEHERFKNAAQMLQQKQMLEAATWTNPGVREFKEDAGAEPEIAADTVDLVRVFRDILERARNRPILDVEEDAVTVGQMIQFLSRRLTMEDKPIALRRLLSHSRSERALIAMFLALLELVRLQAILLRQDSAFCEIFIKKHSDFETVMNQGLARDDWQ